MAKYLDRTSQEWDELVEQWASVAHRFQSLPFLKA